MDARFSGVWRVVMLVAGSLVLTALHAIAQDAPSKSSEPRPLPTVAQKTAGTQAMPGFFPCAWDAKEGKLWVEINRFDTDFLYVESLTAGVGSNDIGLDRGQLGGSHVVRFVRVGPKVLLVEQNLRYRAVTNDASERTALEQSFAQSVLWGFKVEAEEGGRVLIDATPFLLHDAHGVADTLAKQKQGTYKLDDARCALYLPATKSFPKNTEFEAALTFTGKPEGEWVRSVTPDPAAVTVREHQSFVELPDAAGYQPRVFDPRSGYYPVKYADYATPIQEPLVKRFIPRHRLHKKDPSAASSEAVEPIVYYLDPGAPEPIRSALLEGASWWNQAFTAAGYQDAFQVKLLPPDADPMDVRYNVIQWVHRSTRGWSYGASVVDPRTGEILQGRVTLGSLRVRQDFLIAQGLLQPYEHGTEPDPRLLQMALARLRQLAAHEVGHTLGLQHNFAGSADGRTSVMDYPPPYVALDGKGDVDLSQAYATGIGEWDKRTILYGYQDFPVGTDERAGLNAILQENLARGLHYVTDEDARPPGGAHPLAHLWDSGASATDELNRLVKVRAAALSRFGENNLAPGAPMATLENVLVPLYLLHRYQAEAAIKLVGGVNYAYAVRGDGQTTNEPLPTEVQRAALLAVAQTWQPAFLTLPDKVIAAIAPLPPGYERDRELFDPHTGLVFDPLAAAESWVNAALDLLFNPQRLSRIVEQNARGKSALTLSEVFNAVFEAGKIDDRQSPYEQLLARIVERHGLEHLCRVAVNPEAQQQVCAEALRRIYDLHEQVAKRASADPAQQAQRDYLLFRIEGFLRNPKEYQAPKAARLPDGSPIGCGAADFQSVISN